MPAESLWELMEDLSHLFAEQEEGVCAGLGLSPAEYRALRIMTTREGISCQDFARSLRLSPSRGSRVVDRMVGRGFLARSDCDSDRRCKSLTLTALGQDLHRRIRAAIAARESALLRKYPRTRMAALKSGLADLVASFPAE